MRHERQLLSGTIPRAGTQRDKRLLTGHEPKQDVVTVLVGIGAALIFVLL